MLIGNGTGFAVLYTEQPARIGQHSLTVILKGTFRIVPGGSCVRDEEQLNFSSDTLHMDEIGRSLAWPNDLVPFKPNLDFIILGAFHAPGGVPVPHGTAGYQFGPLSKQLRITGPRTATRLSTGHWHISEPLPVTTVPLRWEFSFGGLSDRRNPFGRGHVPATGPVPDRVDLPLIEATDDPPWAFRHAAEPVNVAPVPLLFAGRLRKLGTRDRRWSLFRAPFPPDDYDESHRNAAPDDQQAGNSPVPGEVLKLHNLHPRHPVLSVTLPNARPGLAVMRAGESEAFEVPLLLDTVVALPDQERLVLLWRAVIACNTSDGEEEIEAVECDEAGGLPPGTLAARLTQRLRDAAAAEAAKQAAADAEAIGSVRDLLKPATLPPELEALLASETDPARLQAALEAFLGQIVGDLEKLG